MMDRLLRDCRYAIRMLRKAPGASAIAIVSLALGIAVNTTVFGWMRGVLIDPLPGVADIGRLVTIETVAPSGTMLDSSYPDYQTFRDHTRRLSGVIAFKERLVGLGAERSAESAWALLVSGNYFEVLGLKPAAGRFFEGNERDDAIDAHPVAVLGFAMWKARFNGDPAVIGQTIVLNRRPYTVIGIAPEEFAGTITGLRFDLYVPLTTHPSLTGSAPTWMANRRNRPLYLFARLAPDATIDQAQAEITALAATTAAELPDSNAGISARLLTVPNARRGSQQELGPLLKILSAVGAIVLLIVCANVANLQFARGTARRREIGVRLGLGASRGMVVRQLLTEGFILGAIACGAGVLATTWLIDSLRFFMPFNEFPVVLPTSLHTSDLLFAAALTIVASLLFALAPALRASGGGIVAAMQSGRQTDDPRTSRIGAGLVIGQIALATAALVGAGLLVRSFDNARRMNPGFDTNRVLLMSLNLSTAGYSRADALLYLDRVMDDVQRLPGVRQVALAEDVPLGFDGGSWEDLQIEGYVPQAGENMKIYRNLVSPGYFGLMKIPILDGRDFTLRDEREVPLVAIVNQTFGRRFLGGGNVVGRQFTGWGRTLTIVGVVADSKYHALSEPVEPYFYVPLKQLFTASTGTALHVRTDGDPAAATAAVRGVVRAIDPTVSTDVSTTLAAYTSASYFGQQVAASLMSVLGALALGLSAIGLYGVMTYAVSRRVKEFGVRMALGATRSVILRMMVGRGLALVSLGLAAGGLLTLAGTRALQSLLFGVGPLDPEVLIASATVLLIITGVATIVPARAAASVDPQAALRAE